MDINRRNFLKLAIPATGILALTAISSQKVLAGNSQDNVPSGARKAVLYDSSKCIGCRSCEAACRMKNHLPLEPEPRKLSAQTLTLIESRKLDVNGSSREVFLKRSCMHCTDASCVAVCPTGAASHQGEFSEIDQSWCIGCGYCVESCPFGAVNREEPKGSVRKCTMCIDQVSGGFTPSCVSVCPADALTFGTRTEMVTAAKARVQELTKSAFPEARLYGENDLGGLGQMYILLKPASFYNLPENPQQATEHVVSQWTSGIVAAGALTVPFWWLFKRKENARKQDVEKKEEVK
jgi:formate dehydrogenase beta subunit